MSIEHAYICAAFSGEPLDSCGCNGDRPCRDAPDGPIKEIAMSRLDIATIQAELDVQMEALDRARKRLDIAKARLR